MLTVTQVSKDEAVMDGFERLTHGRAIHKEILSKNLVKSVSHKGQGSYPTTINIIRNDDTIPTWVFPFFFSAMHAN
jgi:hypothetical protein